MHFFNPAPVLPLVEVVRTAHTSDEAFDTAYAFAQRIGKEPVACNDTPGLHRQPDPDPAPERLRARPRRGARQPGGRRPRDALRRELADRPVRADRPDRRRRPRPRVGGAARRARRGADGAAASGCSRCSARATSAARPAAASTSYEQRLATAEPRPDVSTRRETAGVGDRGGEVERARREHPRAGAGSRSTSSPRRGCRSRAGSARAPIVPGGELGARESISIP